MGSTLLKGFPVEQLTFASIACRVRGYDLWQNDSSWLDWMLYVIVWEECLDLPDACTWTFYLVICSSTVYLSHTDNYQIMYFTGLLGVALEYFTFTMRPTVRCEEKSGSAIQRKPTTILMSLIYSQLYDQSTMSPLYPRYMSWNFTYAISRIFFQILQVVHAVGLEWHSSDGLNFNRHKNGH